MTLDEAVGISEVLSNIAAIAIPIAALIFGLRELNKWKRETLGRDRIELAQRIGKTAIRFRDAFLHVVESPIYASEYADRPREDGYPHTYRIKNEAYARHKREVAARLILTELKDYAAEAELLFDLNLNEYIKAYTLAMDELQTLITLYNDTNGGGTHILGYDGEPVFEEEIGKSVRVFAGKDTSLQAQIARQTRELKGYVLRHLK